MIPLTMMFWKVLIFGGTGGVDAGGPARAVLGQQAPMVQRTLRGGWALTGTGLLGQADGVLALSQLPAKGTVVEAWLYWVVGGPERLDGSGLTFAGTDLIGTAVGVAGDLCRGAEATRCYRATITDLVGGNGNYAIHGFPNVDHVQGITFGAAVLVLYTDPDAEVRGFLLYDGLVSLSGSLDEWGLAIEGFQATGNGSADLLMAAVDGQEDLADGPLLFNGHSLGSDLWQGADGPAWDSLAVDVSDYLDTGTSEAALRLSVAEDCVAFPLTALAVEGYASHSSAFVEPEPAGIDFGTVDAAGQPALRQVVLTHGGPNDGVTITDILLTGSGAFTVEAPVLPITILPGEQLALSLSFTGAAGLHRGQLQIVNNGSVSLVTAALHGIGAQPVPVLDGGRFWFLCGLLMVAGLIKGRRSV